MGSKNQKKNQIENRTRNISIVMILTLLSKVFGFTRDMILANYYGASNVSDAYLVSLTIPEFVFSLVIQAIAVGFIPIFVEILGKDGEDRANKFTNQVLTMMYICGAVVVVFMNLFPNAIVRLFANGFNDATVALTVNFVRITAAAVLFKGTVSVLSAYCEAKGEFARPALVGLPMDIIMISSIIISYKTNTILLAYGTVCAYAAQLIPLIPHCYHQGFRYKFQVNLRDPYLKRMLAMFLPVIIGVGANQVNILVDRSIASTIEIGGISALNYANKVDNIMENVIVMSIAGVMYPLFSTFSSQRKFKELTQSIQTCLEEVMLLIFPITVGSIVLAEPIIQLLFGRGAFDFQAIKMTSMAMVGYSIGMIGVSIRAVLTRVYYSLQDVKTTVLNSVLTVGINIVLNYILSRFLGIWGLALASSIASLFCAMLLLLGLRKKIELHLNKIVISGTKIFVPSVFMGVVVVFSYKTLCLHIGYTISLFVSTIIGVIVYFAMALIFKLPGLSNWVHFLKN